MICSILLEQVLIMMFLFNLPEETYLQMGGNPGAMTVGIEAEGRRGESIWKMAGRLSG